MDPQFKADLDAALNNLAAAFPAGEPKNIKLTQSVTSKDQPLLYYALTYSYEFGGKSVSVQIVLGKSGSDFLIEGIHFVYSKEELERANAFTFAGKGLIHYLFFLAAIMLPLFTLATAIICWRTPIPRLKWLWFLFVLFGFVGFRMNWTTGAIDIQPLQFILFSAAFTKNPYGPLLLQIAIPAGAIIFWFRRRIWLGPTAVETMENF